GAGGGGGGREGQQGEDPGLHADAGRSARRASLILYPPRSLVVRTVWRTRDDLSQDVVGSFPDSHQGRIAVEPLDLVFGRVPAPKRRLRSSAISTHGF